MSRQIRRALQSVRVESDYIRLSGGTDEISPPYERADGSSRIAVNFEAVTRGGYRRNGGYERFDGTKAPSTADYTVIDVEFSGSVSIADVVTGATSGAVGIVVAVSGSIENGHIVVVEVNTTFVADENLLVLGDVVARSKTAGIRNSASTQLLKSTYKHLAAQHYRKKIGKVPGVGAILGVVEYNDSVYAFRAKADGSGVCIYKSGFAGWTLVSLGKELAFTSGGNTEIVEGQTITGATSGAMAVIARVIKTSGSWSAGTAVGRFILSTQIGAFQSENLNVGATTNLATIAGNSADISLVVGGRFTFIIKNFTGASGTRRIYGCDGVNRGFEFDGVTLAPINTGMAVDAPRHLVFHKYHLFFSFGASIQHSAPGQPFVWSAVLGAAELALGDNVTGFSSQPGSVDGGALSIFSKNSSHVLYGSGVSNWNLVPYRDELGAYEHTIQDVGFTVFLDDRGITDFRTAQTYGNFAHMAISDKIRDSINKLRRLAISSCISRDKNQYRLFFSDGSAYYATFAGQKPVGLMKQVFPKPVMVVWHGEAENGEERIYFGSDDGYVYQMERGTSFDGDSIEAFFDLSYGFQKSPRYNKVYRSCTMEISSDAYANMKIGYALGYGAAEVPQPIQQDIASNFFPAIWDEVVWDEFVWDGLTLMPTTVDIRGEAENISMIISSNSAILESFDITAMILGYTIRRRLRP